MNKVLFPPITLGSTCFTKILGKEGGVHRKIIYTITSQVEN